MATAYYSEIVSIAKVVPAPDAPRPHHEFGDGVGGVDDGAATVRIDLFSSSFCGACRGTRKILDTVARLVPGIVITEINVADDPDAAEQEEITVTPTVIIRNAGGTQTFRASGAPNINQVLAAVASQRHE